MIHTSMLSRHYDTLIPWERLPLIAAASVRGDEVEADRLARSAPKRSWQLPDYYGLAEGLREQAVQYLLEQLNAGSVFWEAMYVLPQKSKTADQTGSMPQWMRLLAYAVVARAEGWRLLCADLHLDGEALLRLLPGYEATRRLEEAARRLALSQEKAAAYLRDCIEIEDHARPVQAKIVSIDGPAQIATAMREALEQRLKDWS